MPTFLDDIRRQHVQGHLVYPPYYGGPPVSLMPTDPAVSKLNILKQSQESAAVPLHRAVRRCISMSATSLSGPQTLSLPSSQLHKCSSTSHLPTQQTQLATPPMVLTNTGCSSQQSLLSRVSSPVTPRYPVREPPVRFRVYYMPDRQHVSPSSIIHSQKRQNGFFKHPVLCVGSGDRYIYFYALTKAPPNAIKDLGMCLRIGYTTQDEGENVLRLAEHSEKMQRETWVNLEQLFCIEWELLDYWMADVSIDLADWNKLDKKVWLLEARQNRFIYKPLQRDLSSIVPGTVVMLPNPPESSTLGAPVIVLVNQYPRFRFLRIKVISDNINFQAGGTEKSRAARSLCLEMCRFPKQGHDGTPVLLYEPNSPEMRELSYVEMHKKSRWGRLDKCKTWCWPHVQIQAASMKTLWRYLENLPDAEEKFTTSVYSASDPAALPQYATATMPSYAPGAVYTPQISPLIPISHQGVDRRMPSCTVNYAPSHRQQQGSSGASQASHTGVHSPYMGSPAPPPGLYPHSCFPNHSMMSRPIAHGFPTSPWCVTPTTDYQINKSDPKLMNLAQPRAGRSSRVPLSDISNNTTMPDPRGQRYFHEGSARYQR